MLTEGENFDSALAVVMWRLPRRLSGVRNEEHEHASREEKDLLNSHMISTEPQYILYYGRLQSSSYCRVKNRNMSF